MGEPSESAAIEPRCKLTVICAETVYTEIEFLGTEKKRFAYILLNDVGLC